VLNLLNKFKRERGLTCLFIAHDLSIVRFISDRIGVIYKGDIVEVAEAEELFNFPLHPYTRSLISAIPIPDPTLEKNKVLFTYDPSIHDYSEDKPELVDVGDNHLVYGNKKEIEEYKRIKQSGEHPKSITILSPEEAVKAQEEYKKKKEEISNSSTDSEIMDRPIHDTGSVLYTILGFFLPLVGLILWLSFKHVKYYRNYKAAKKGTIIGLIVIGAIIVLFLLALLIALI
jgi:oligopeptide transport system ATP-binding protein